MAFWRLASSVSYLLSSIDREAGVAIQEEVVVAIADHLLLLLNLVLLLNQLLLLVLLLQLLLLVLLLLQLLDLVGKLSALQLVSEKLLRPSRLLLLPRSELHLLGLQLLLRLGQRPLQLLDLLLLLFHNIFRLLQLCFRRGSHWQCGRQCCKPWLLVLRASQVERQPQLTNWHWLLRQHNCL